MLKLTCSLLLLLHLLPATNPFTLNVPNVLLPLHIPQTLHTNFTLSADSGCFEWLTTKELVVSIRPLYEDSSTTEGCSRRSELTSLSQDPDRQLSLILARETSTESELRVDVFVDTITRIAIRTTSLELLLEETPSTFEIVAYDDDGNTFSTLEGLEFIWTIEPDAEHQVSGNVLKNILYSDSFYLTPPTIGILESQGKQGGKILVQGINTGVAWVKARLAHPSYKAVVEVSVRVVVIENLLLNPPYDVWMLPLTQIRYKAERRQHGRKTVIEFPSEQYWLKLSNTTIGEISDDTTVTSLMLGDSDVILVDKNVQHLPLGTPPHTTIHVVPPTALLFKIETKNWNFETDKEYTFTISVLGPNNRPVLNTDNIRIKLTVEDSHMTLISSNTEGTLHTVLAKDTGSAKIVATLDILIHPKTGEEHPVEPPVSSSQAVEIRSPITVTPAVVILPIYKLQPFTYGLSAAGGSGEYVWSSRDTSLVTVTKEGVVTGRGEGREMVTASDAKNTDNSGSAEVIVAELSGLTFLPSKVETLVGSTLRLNLAAYIELEPGTKLPFTRCDLVPLVYSLSNDLFVMEKEEKPGGDLAQGVCSIITVTGARPGSSILKVTYATSRETVLSATIVIAAYLPLKLTYPSHTLILTLGSSHLLTLSGGPGPWVTDKSGYTEEMQSVGGGYSADLVSTKGAHGVSHSFRVTCLILGEQLGMVIVGNKITADNRYPATESLTVKVRCEVPGILSLSHSLPSPPSTCPFSDQLATMTKQDVKVHFLVKTPDDLLFDNSSSLLFHFTSSDVELLTVDVESASGIETSQSTLVSHLLENTGSVELSVTVDQYDEVYLIGDMTTELESGLSESVRFKLVNELSIEPTSLTMFNYEEGSREVTVSGGSGTYSSTVNSPGVVNMSTGDSSPILMTPHLQGVTTLTVQDLCLPQQAARCNVHVTGPAEVVIRTVSQLEIHSSALLSLSVIDSNNRKISSAVFPKLDLRHQISSDPHISIHSAEDQTSCDEFCTLYQVRGISLGTSTVQFSVSGSTNVDSNLLSITVFPPLLLSPSPLVLVEGAVFQLRYSGGPQHDSSLEFSSLNTTTATINQRALVTGVVEGSVEVVGKCIGVRSDSDVIYSKAAVSVEVIKLKGIEIQAPSTYIIESSEIPLTVWGSDGLSPFTFASVTGIVFTWTSSSDKIQLNSLYHKSGYTVDDEKQFAVSAKGLEKGITVISATATYTDSNGDVIKLSDSISIQVIRKAVLVAPAGPDIPDLVLGPGSVYNIRTNKDHSHTVHYSLLQGAGVITVHTDGAARADKLGVAVLKIDILEDHNVNQTILLNIQVKTPFALLLEESTAPSGIKRPSEYPYYTLPMGLTASFVVKTKDDLGRQFDSLSKTSYFYTLNRLDVISVDSVGTNNSLSLTGSNVGEGIVRVYTDTGLEGWGYIRVSSPLDIPVFTLLHLSTVCIPDLQGEEKGDWSSGDTNIATVKGGVVRGENLGVTELKKQITSSTYSIIRVEIVKAESVILSLPPDTLVLSNIATSLTVSNARLPVTVTTSKPLSELPATCGGQQSAKIPFECASSHPSVVTASADTETGSCIVTALPNTAVSTVSPLVTVKVKGAVSSSIQIPFVSRFKLSGEKTSLSSESPTTDIFLVEGDFSLVQVTLDDRAGGDLNIIKTSSHFHLSLLNRNTQAVHSLTFICPTSGQKEVYKVLITPSEPHLTPPPIKLEFSELISTLLPTVVLGLLVLLIVIGIVFLTTASYRRLKSTSSQWDSPLTMNSMLTTPVKIGSPFRPASVTVTPTRLKTPLYTKPRGTPGSI